MESFNASTLWDISLPPSLPALADDDFIALLQKQFGANNAISALDNKDDSAPIANINPQSLTCLPPTRLIDSPPSEDSSPSPPSINDALSSKSRRHSGVYADASSSRLSDDDDDDPTLKRKASEEDQDDEPSHKSQHTSGSKKNPGTRRKSTGNSNADESRLLKRKEQNRAAQRAFRERKEKHVKDLEDKVAALEEKNSASLTENESLREVVSRLQAENVRLRQSAFTFTVPSSASSSKSTATNDSSRGSPHDPQQDASMNLYNPSPSVSASSSASTHDSPQSLFANDKNDDTLSFLEQRITVLNPEQQQTATADAMGMDFGFGPTTNSTPYTTIASNPLFMSFREPDSFDNFGHANQSYSQPNLPFDFSQQYFSGWPDVAMDNTGTNGMQAFDLTNSLDELFGGSSYVGQGIDFMNFGKTSSSNSLSPVSHQNSNTSQHGSNTSSSSLGSSPNLLPSSDASSESKTGCDGVSKCTKENIAKFVAQDNGSVFAPKTSSFASGSEETSPLPLTPVSGSESNDACSEFPPCKGLQLPKTQKNEKNVEVMSAWKKIRHDPKYQDVDINELCSEFASKAKCDGCQVVIEPSGMKEILDTVQKTKKAKLQSSLFQVGNSAIGLSSVLAK
ncbi:hypothetical protein EW145_g176 [Phellinidium pouzarii]|uniref:BZIP domain-containing protein n=1 Tax=Phellinidium pouzarii TaxID=167371 RepID=A0A4S4LJK9_9AGAM|nr:hypothetical protein EW145_g176 [Phellinidium pouzarii]